MVKQIVRKVQPKRFAKKEIKDSLAHEVKVYKKAPAAKKVKVVPKKKKTIQKQKVHQKPKVIAKKKVIKPEPVKREGRVRKPKVVEEKQIVEPVKKVKVAKEKKEPKVKTTITMIAYNPDQLAKYNQILTEWKNKNLEELKQMLAKNQQTKSGTKDEVLKKVADGFALGRIPNCPKCFGGRPKFDSKKGTYYCVGFRDDVDFKNCHSTFTMEELKRDVWIE